MAVNINVPSQVRTFANLAAFPATGALKTIYIAEDTNKTYRWTGSVYVEVSASASGITIGSTTIASGVVGRVLFEGAGNVVQESSSLSFDDTAKAFTLSGNQNTPTVLNVSNTTSGTAANAILRLTSDSGAGYYDIFKLSTTFTTYKTLVAKDAGFYNTASGGDFSFLNDNASGRFKIAVGASSTAQFIVQSTGNVGIGTTTDSGFRLDVNGTARVQGQLTTSVNQNNPTRISITNTTSGTLAGTEILLNTHSGALMAAGKVSNAYTPYKTLAAGDGYLYNTTFGDISLLNDFATGRIKFAAGGASTSQMTLFSTGNLGINTTTDAGFRLDVNGTARVSGNTNISLNQNGQTKATISNTTSGTSSRVDFILTSDGGAGEANLGKFSSTTTAYKILAARDSFLYNNPTAGDIAILNDFTTGRIKFAAGGSSTAQMTLKASGVLNLSSVPTSPAGLSTGDVWNNLGVLMIV